MKYSIFHTSHCGSTYLSALLSKSIPTLTEPNWSHELKNKENPIKHIEQNHLNNQLIKYSSVYCYLMPQIKDKKVFLYRPLISHINKLKGGADLAFHLNTMTPNFHYKTKMWDIDESEITLQTALWMDRCFWAIEASKCSDVLLINAHDLFDNPQATARKVCGFFGIKYIQTNIDYNVKLANLNHTNEPINLDNILNDDNFIEPIYPVNFKLLKWADEFIESHPKLKYFV